MVAYHNNVFLQYKIPMHVGPHICNIHEESSVAQKTHVNGNLQNMYKLSCLTPINLPQSLILYTRNLRFIVVSRKIRQ
jgi:hypothetical protein